MGTAESLNLILAGASIALAVFALVHAHVQYRDASRLQQDAHDTLAKITERVERIVSHSSRQVDRAWEYVTDTSRQLAIDQQAQQQHDETRKSELNHEIVQAVIQMLQVKLGKEFNKSETEIELMRNVSGITDRFALETRLSGKISDVDCALVQFIGDSREIIDNEAKDCVLKSISPDALDAYKSAITLMNRLKDKKADIDDTKILGAVQTVERVLQIVLAAIGHRDLLVR